MQSKQIEKVGGVRLEFTEPNPSIPEMTPGSSLGGCATQGGVVASDSANFDDTKQPNLFVRITTSSAPPMSESELVRCSDPRNDCGLRVFNHGFKVETKEDMMQLLWLLRTKHCKDVIEAVKYNLKRLNRGGNYFVHPTDHDLPKETAVKLAKTYKREDLVEAERWHVKLGHMSGKRMKQMTDCRFNHS